jgi:hypothetical protein
MFTVPQGVDEGLFELMSLPHPLNASAAAVAAPMTVTFFHILI